MVVRIPTKALVLAIYPELRGQLRGNDRLGDRFCLGRLVLQ